MPWILGTIYIQELFIVQNKNVQEHTASVVNALELNQFIEMICRFTDSGGVYPDPVPNLCKKTGSGSDCKKTRFDLIFAIFKYLIITLKFLERFGSAGLEDDLEGPLHRF